MPTETKPKPSLQSLAADLKREPLIGVTAAANVLGIKPPNFRRDAAPHLTEVPVEGSASVYFRSEVRELARQRRRVRRTLKSAAAQNGSHKS